MSNPVYSQGRPITLSVQWFQFAGGPAAVVTGVGIEVKPLAGGASLVGPTTVGVLNPATGVNVYVWNVGAGQPPVGDYLVVWTGTDQQGQAVQTSEIITVVASASGPGGPCGTWTPIFECALPTGASAVTGVAVQAATEVLWGLSGRQFGLCTVTLRPCRRECYGEVWPPGWGQYGQAAGYPQPALVAGQWFNLGCGGCAGDCSCSVVSEVVLPGPVHDVLEVKVDGVALVKNVDYRVDDFRLLVRLGGKTWPTCNDLTRADTQMGTWSVTLRAGQDVPAMGQLAVGELATEFTHLLLCNDKCRLPKSVQSLARQGVNVTFLDPSTVFQNGRTGLYLSDLFINTVNPSGRRGRARAYDIDSYPGNSRVTGTG